MLPKLPKDLVSLLTELYSTKCHILEYGTGGSTMLGLTANSGNLVIGCETDSDWLEKVIQETITRGCRDRLIPVYQDIGPTRVWGHPCFEGQPLTTKRCEKFFSASLKPWKELNRLAVEPDIVFIDGRFRVGAFCSTAAMIKKETTVIFDDYTTRPQYHLVEAISKPSSFCDRAAVFSLQPGALSPIEFVMDYGHLLLRQN